MSIKVILADDHVMVREGLRSLVLKDPDMEVVGEAGDGRAAVDLAGRLPSDVVVMDIGMPDLNGIEATRQIVAANPRAKVVALSAYADPGYVRGILEAGARGYVLKTAASEELLRAIQAVMAGRHYLSGGIAGVVINSVINRDAPIGPDAYCVLAPREREVLQSLAEGKSAKETAASLDISTRTVETHRRNIIRKLNLHSIAELTKYAIREGITGLD